MFEKNELNVSAISLLFVISLLSIRSTWSCLHFFDFEFNARRSTSHVRLILKTFCASVSLKYVAFALRLTLLNKMQNFFYLFLLSSFGFRIFMRSSFAL